MSTFLEKFKKKEILLIVITLLLRITPSIYTPLIADLSAFFQVGSTVLSGGSPYSLGGAYAYPPLGVILKQEEYGFQSFFRFLLK